ncbi:hypothetical protein LC612_42700, partial [Nostoc sp. CHAB 5834]|nr:hypothetical protein [Nostoc sp. CHAB 5834]
MKYQAQQAQSPHTGRLGYGSSYHVAPPPSGHGPHAITRHAQQQSVLLPKQCFLRFNDLLKLPLSFLIVLLVSFGQQALAQTSCTMSRLVYPPGPGTMSPVTIPGADAFGYTNVFLDRFRWERDDFASTGTQTGASGWQNTSCARNVSFRLTWGNRNPETARSGLFKLSVGGVQYFQMETGRNGSDIGTISYLNGATGTVTSISTGGGWGSNDQLITFTLPPTVANNGDVTMFYDPSGGGGSGIGGDDVATSMLNMETCAKVFVDGAVTNQSICSGNSPSTISLNPAPSSENLNGATVSYQWQSASSSSGPWSDVSGATDPTYAPPALTATTYYRLRATLNYNANGVTGNCESFSDPTTITVNPLPIATASASPNPVCAGSSFTLTSSGGSSYNWAGPDGFTSTLDSPTRTGATPAMAGTYSVTVTSAAGCTAVATTDVIVNPLPP